MELSLNKDYAPVLAARFLLCFPSNSSLSQGHLTLSSAEVSVFGPVESQQWSALCSCLRLIKHLQSRYKVHEFIFQYTQMYKNLQRQVHKTEPSESYIHEAQYLIDRNSPWNFGNIWCVIFACFLYLLRPRNRYQHEKTSFRVSKHRKWKCKVFHS